MPIYTSQMQNPIGNRHIRGAKTQKFENIEDFQKNRLSHDISPKNRLSHEFMIDPPPPPRGGPLMNQGPMFQLILVT